MWSWLRQAFSLIGNDERGFINFGMSKSESSQQARSGLAQTGQEGVGANIAIGSLQQTAGLAQEAAAAPFGTYMGQPIGNFMPTGRYGLHSATDTALDGIMRDYFSRSSANQARRGGMTPESFGAAAGSAGAEASKFLFPQIQQYQQYLAELAPRLYGQRLGFAGEPARLTAPLLGSQSVASSSSFGFGGGVGADNSTGKILPMGG